jgi:asparagine synthase (glutamine-hydrolysing)
MFAFALWDREKQTLFLARDRLGKKPLHYAVLPDGTLAFASEIKAILQYPEIDRTLDNHAVEDFFAFGHIPDPKTIYRSIRKLPPASMLTVKRDGTFAIRRYWDLIEASAAYEGTQGSEAELVERLGEAVKSRLVADVEVGAFLSGGVDSSAVVALMAQAAPGPVNTFSIGFNEQKFDETAYAKQVAERYHTRHVTRTVTSDGFSLLPKLAEIFDEPFGDSSAIPTYFVCAETAQFLKVCLSGDGGDEALAGYRRYAFHTKEERVRAVLPQTLRAPVFGLAAALYPKLDWAPRALRAKTTLQELSLDAADAYFRIVAALPDDVRQPLNSSDFNSQIADHPIALRRGGIARSAPARAICRHERVPAERHPGQSRSHEHGQLARSPCAISRSRVSRLGVCVADTAKDR